MFIKIGQQIWIKSQYIESICIVGKNEVRVYIINSDKFYECGVYDTYEEAVNAMNKLVERLNKERSDNNE